MFGTQSERLLRDNWPNARDLAMELYAIFQDQNPVETGGGLTVSAPLGVSPLNLTPPNAFADSIPAISFGKKSTDPAFHWLPDGGIQLAAPYVQLAYTNPDGSRGMTQYGDPPGGRRTRSPKKKEKKSKPSGIPGTILSGGPGAAYQLNIFPDGLQAASQTVAATCLQIAASETIPAGTWVVVCQTTDSAYSFQVPVWL